MTDRQLLRAVIEGRSKTDIAREFGIAGAALEARLQALLARLAHTYAEAASPRPL